MLGINNFTSKKNTLYIYNINGNSNRLYFLGLQITVDGDCSHEIKRCLLLGRKAMTNLPAERPDVRKRDRQTSVS